MFPNNSSLGQSAAADCPSLMRITHGQISFLYTYPYGIVYAKKRPTYLVDPVADRNMTYFADMIALHWYQLIR